MKKNKNSQPQTKFTGSYKKKECSYKTGQKKASLHFHEDQELKRKWIYFANRKDWLPNAHSVKYIAF